MSDRIETMCKQFWRYGSLDPRGESRFSTEKNERRTQDASSELEMPEWGN